MMKPSAIPVFSMFLALFACEASARDLWDRFLQNPEAQSFAELSEIVDASQCGWGKSANKEVVPDRVREPLFNLVASGNESAFVIGLSAVRCFDGADLEDFYRSSGHFMETRPRRFLTEVSERQVGSSDVASMAASVPTNDDPDSALKKVAERIALLRDLNDERIASAQAESVRALREREADLRRMKANLQEGT